MLESLKQLNQDLKKSEEQLKDAQALFKSYIQKEAELDESIYYNYTLIELEQARIQKLKASIVRTQNEFLQTNAEKLKKIVGEKEFEEFASNSQIFCDHIMKL
ncbi:MAG: hypothetical protein FWE07_04645 [Turicibacter sp.]|nr:hypothetical protein [Turicibacter sp.]